MIKVMLWNTKTDRVLDLVLSLLELKKGNKRKPYNEPSHCYIQSVSNHVQTFTPSNFINKVFIISRAEDLTRVISPARTKRRLEQEQLNKAVERGERLNTDT